MVVKVLFPLSFMTICTIVLAQTDVERAQHRVAPAIIIDSFPQILRPDEEYTARWRLSGYHESYDVNISLTGQDREDFYEYTTSHYLQEYGDYSVGEAREIVSYYEHTFTLSEVPHGEIELVFYTSPNADNIDDGFYSTRIVATGGSDTAGFGRRMILTGVSNSVGITAEDLQFPWRLSHAENAAITEAINDQTFVLKQTLGSPFHNARDRAGFDETHAYDLNIHVPWNAEDREPVYPVYEGTVVEVNQAYGSVLLQHDTPLILDDGENVLTQWYSGYMHMNLQGVEVGDEVNVDTVLGRTSNVSASSDAVPVHLHFGVYQLEGSVYEALDIYYVLRRLLPIDHYNYVFEDLDNCNSNGNGYQNAPWWDVGEAPCPQ